MQRLAAEVLQHHHRALLIVFQAVGRYDAGEVQVAQHFVLACEPGDTLRRREILVKEFQDHRLIIRYAACAVDQRVCAGISSWLMRYPGIPGMARSPLCCGLTPTENAPCLEFQGTASTR